MKPASFHHSGIPSGCITPLVLTQPGAETFPGVASGTGFFAKVGREVYLFTALHCLESVNPKIDYLTTAKRLTIPFRLAGATHRSHDYVLFDYATLLAENKDLPEFIDVVALHIKPERSSNHKHLLSRAAKLPPNGLWLNRFADLDQVKSAMDAGERITFVVIGYPNNGTTTGIEYKTELPEITSQPAQFTGNLRPVAELVGKSVQVGGERGELAHGFIVAIGGYGHVVAGAADVDACGVG